MQKRNRFKPRLTITKIGRFRFWTGIVLGVLQAVVFFLFVFLLSDVFITLNVLYGEDLHVFSENTKYIQKVILIATSVSFGINTSLRYWCFRLRIHHLQIQKHSFYRLQHKLNFTHYLTLYITGIFLQFVVSGFYFTLPRFINVYSWIWLSIPLLIFFSSWNDIIKYYKASKWMLYSFMILICSTLVLSTINYENKKYHLEAYARLYSEEFSYIEKETQHAKDNYGIYLKDETIQTLKEVRSERSMEQYYKVANAFDLPNKVSLDTIILQKMIVHNFKMQYYKYYTYEKSYYKKRHFLSSKTIYLQLQLHQPNSPEAFELLSILEEMYELSFYANGHNSNPELSKLITDKIYYYKRIRRELRNIYTMNLLHVVLEHLSKENKYYHPILDKIKKEDSLPSLPVIDDTFLYK